MFGGRGLPWSMLCTLESLPTGTGGVTVELPAGLDISAKRPCSQTVPGREEAGSAWASSAPLAPCCTCAYSVIFASPPPLFLYHQEDSREDMEIAGII